MLDPTAGSPAATGAGPSELSAQGLHELAVQAFRIGNRGRLSLCDALRGLSETRLYFDLGFPSLAAYADAFFQLRRAEAFEYVRVANALLELTELREAFAGGAIAWSVLKAVTRVAGVGSQRAWIDFAQRNGGERTLAEARDALRRRRDAPRAGSFGLPNLDQRLVLRFPRSDMEKVRAWIESACDAVAEKTGGSGISTEQAVLFLCEQGMASAARSDGAPGATSSSAAGPGSCPARAQLVYHRCPDCSRARMGTREGFVEVAPEEVERYEDCAEPVVIDGPTPPGLRRRILAREGGRCANPRCHNPAEHCHHIRPRSVGGKTCLENEAAVCSTCHALAHAGLLLVTSDAGGNLNWAPVGADSLRARVSTDGLAAARLPVVNVVAAATAATGAAGATGVDGAIGAVRPTGAAGAPGAIGATGAVGAIGEDEAAQVSDVLDAASATGCAGTGAATPARMDRRESAFADSSGRALAAIRDGATGSGLDLDGLAQGLTRLGIPAARSRRIIRAVIESQPPGALTESGVLRRALAAI